MTDSDELKREAVNEILIKQLETILDKKIPKDIIQQMQVTDIDRLLEIGSNIMTINGLDDLREKLNEQEQ